MFITHRGKSRYQLASCANVPNLFSYTIPFLSLQVSTGISFSYITSVFSTSHTLHKKQPPSAYRIGSRNTYYHTRYVIINAYRVTVRPPRNHYFAECRITHYGTSSFDSQHQRMVERPVMRAEQGIQLRGSRGGRDGSNVPYLIMGHRTTHDVPLNAAITRQYQGGTGR